MKKTKSNWVTEVNLGKRPLKWNGGDVMYFQETGCTVCDNFCHVDVVYWANSFLLAVRKFICILKTVWV